MSPVENSFWWMEAAGGLVFVIAIQYAAAMVMGLLKKRIAGGGWRASLLQAVKGPWLLALWTVGVVFILDVVSQQLGFSIVMNYLSPIRSAVVVGAVVWLLLRWQGEIQKSIANEGMRKIDLTTFQIIGKVVTIAVLVLAVLIVLQLFGINTAPLLAFGGVGAASIGFASKDVIANFCSGLILHISRPFIVGEEISLPEKNLEGVIEEIGWFRTTIRDLDKRALYLPNNCFSTMLLINVSRMTHRRFQQTIQIPFEEIGKVAVVTQKIQEALRHHSAIDAHQPIHVYLHAFGDWSLQLNIEAFAKRTRKVEFNELQQEILLLVSTILQAAKVPIQIQQMRQLS